MSDIHAAAEAQFGTSRNLQYYHTADQTWRNLVNDDDLTAFQTYYRECVAIPTTDSDEIPPSSAAAVAAATLPIIHTVVPIRIPEYYATTDNDDPDYEEDLSLDDTMSSAARSLEGMIEHLVQVLMESKWACEEHSSIAASNTTAATNNTTEDSSESSSHPNDRPSEPLTGATSTSHDESASSSDDNDPNRSESSTTNVTHNHTASSPKQYRLIKEVISTVDARTTTTGTDTVQDMMVQAGWIPETTTVRSHDHHDNDGSAAPETKQYQCMNTKDFVLTYASQNAELRGLLFYLPNALDHIVECLHYQFLWDHYRNPNNDVTAVVDRSTEGNEWNM